MFLEERISGKGGIMDNFYATKSIYMRTRMLSEKTALVERGNKYLSATDVLIKLAISLISGGIILFLCVTMDVFVRDDLIGVTLYWTICSAAIMAALLLWSLFQKTAIERQISRINRRVLWQK